MRDDRAVLIAGPGAPSYAPRPGRIAEFTNRTSGYGACRGVYLRGRHEVQIEDSPAFRVRTEALGAIYGFLPPSEDAARGPGRGSGVHRGVHRGGRTRGGPPARSDGSPPRSRTVAEVDEWNATLKPPPRRWGTWRRV